MIDVEREAAVADVIINGYAFSKCDIGYRVLNLNDPNKAVVLSQDGEMLETTMDGIEVNIVRKYYLRNKELMEE